jgi:hypothetical protein
MSKNFKMSLDNKETKFNVHKLQNNNNDSVSTVDTSAEAKPNFELINHKLKSLLRTNIPEDSKRAINYIVDKFKFKPISYLTQKSVVLFGTATRKAVIKFVKIF